MQGNCHLYIPATYNLSAIAASVNGRDGIGWRVAPPFPVRQGGIKSSRAS